MVIDMNCQFFGVGDLDARLRGMDSAGIDRALLSASLEGAIIPGRDEPLRGVGNAEVARAVAAHPDRLIGCFHVNPLDPRARATVDEYAARGFKAAKLFPSEGYYVDDPRFYDLFDLIQDRGLAAVVYCGQVTMGLSREGGKRRALNSAYGYPMRLDAPSRLFPRVRFVIVHMGFPCLFEAWSVHHANKNIYLDISGQGPCFDALPVGYAALGGGAFIPLDFGKVVWGTDNAEDMAGTRTVADAHLRQMGCVSGEQRRAVFGANALAVLEPGA